jgi:RNA polymerase sigma-70 factor, ECF subfamily
MTDELIVKFVLKGNTQLFSEIVNRYKEKVYSLTYRFTEDMGEAQDLSQEVFITVYKKLYTFKESSRFSTWLYRINYNLCIDWQRKNKKRKKMNVEVNDNIESGNSFNLEDSFIETQKRGAVRSSINSMDEKYRTVLILFHFEGFSYEDIGEVLGIPVKTVETRLYRARGILKKELSRYGYGGEFNELQTGSFTN